jgi:hypothetical protein
MPIIKMEMKLGNDVIQLWYIVKIFETITMYSQYNNNKKEKKEISKRMSFIKA